MSNQGLAVGARTIQHGTQIYAYNNLRTNQVVYSFTRALNNNSSIKQLPFLGKKTVPAALRKDLWQPFALIEFPSPVQGLSAFRKLREYRRLHENEYPLDLITLKDGPHKGQLLEKKKRGRVLQNQKANSVADMAAVLLIQERPPTPEQLEKAERFVRNDGRPPAKRGFGKKQSSEVDYMGTVDGVTISWANILDAEFAETWPAPVVHQELTKQRYTAAFPLPDAEGELAAAESRQERRAELIQALLDADNNIYDSERAIGSLRRATNYWVQKLGPRRTQ